VTGDLFDAGASQEARDDAMRRAEENADREWKERAWGYLARFAACCETFKAEDLWKAGLDKPREPRAIGPLFMRAAREGLIEYAGTERSVSKARHAGSASVWRSLVCVNTPRRKP
jgi:hypothetical protein